jgi:hypothetical protein
MDAHAAGGGGDNMRGQKMKNEMIKYDWVPHEVKREYAENVAAYVLIGVVLLSLTIGIALVALDSFG